MRSPGSGPGSRQDMARRSRAGQSGPGQVRPPRPPSRRHDVAPRAARACDRTHRNGPARARAGARGRGEGGAANAGQVVTADPGTTCTPHGTPDRDKVKAGVPHRPLRSWTGAAPARRCAGARESRTATGRADGTSAFGRRRAPEASLSRSREMIAGPLPEIPRRPAPGRYRVGPERIPDRPGNALRKAPGNPCGRSRTASPNPATMRACVQK